MGVAELTPLMPEMTLTRESASAMFLTEAGDIVNGALKPEIFCSVNLEKPLNTDSTITIAIEAMATPAIDMYDSTLTAAWLLREKR